MEGLETVPLTEQVQAILAEGEVTLPPFPKVGARLLELLKDEDRADATAIATLVQTDPAITATILRLANSAAFGGLSPIKDLRQAVSRLGLRRVHSLVTTLVLRDGFKASGRRGRRVEQALWDHSVAVALAARRLVGAGGGDPEETYLAGLLHDVGKLLVLEAVDHIERRQPGLELTADVFDELMAVLHPRLGHDILRQWRLPEPICRAALRHHEPDLDGGEILVVRVQAANALARKLEDDQGRAATCPCEEDPAIQRLNLTDMELACLLVDLEDEVARIRELV